MIPNPINQESIPKQTLYINNLNEKIQPTDMKYALYFLFNQFGEVVDIVAKKNNALRGQAFIIFRDITAATTAKDALNGFLLFDKQMGINFSRQRSDVLETLQGNFSKKNRQKIMTSKDKKEIKKEFRQAPTGEADFRQEKKVDEEYNNVLMIKNLPANVTDEMLKILFSQYPGVVEIQVYAPLHTALIHYDKVEQARVALLGLNKFQISKGSFLQIQFAQK